jgi:CRP-like cAMP-binding protein
MGKMRTFAFDEKYSEVLDDFGIGDIHRNEISIARYEKGDVVCHENQLLGYFVICVGGHGKSYVNERNGKSLILNIFKKGYVIGDYELIMNFATMTTVIADTVMTCILIPLKSYRDYLLNNLAFMRKVSEILANKLYASLHHSAASRLMPLEYRLCVHLSKVTRHGIFNFRLTDTAEMLGVSYRHLLRTMAALVSQGIITKTSSGYSVDLLKLNHHIEMF